MSSVTFDGVTYAAEEGETVLEALLRHGVDVSYSCRTGICGACEMVATAGTLSPQSQSAMPSNKRTVGHFRACQCVVSDPIVIGASAEWCSAMIRERDMLSPRVLRLRVERPEWDYRAGQFVNIRNPDGVIRSYSIASEPSVGYLEFHVARVEGGRFSQWLHDSAKVGQHLSMRGPDGSCFYESGKPEQPLLMIATGTGLAPLWGILETALSAGHSGPITLMHGGRRAEDLYLVDEAQRLAESQPNFQYVPVVKTAMVEGGIHGDLKSARPQVVGSCAGSRVFLCGNPDMVAQMRQDVFLAGADFQDILADAFVRTSEI